MPCSRTRTGTRPGRPAARGGGGPGTRGCRGAFHVHGCHLLTTVYPSDLAVSAIEVCHAGSMEDRDLPAVRAGRTVLDHGVASLNLVFDHPFQTSLAALRNTLETLSAK